MSPAQGILAPLDAGRSWLLRIVGPVAAPLFADREARVGVSAAFAVASAFVLTCAAPMWLLAFGPVVLGVPHLVADMRYLVVRTGLHRRSGVWLAIGLSVVMPFLCGHAWGGLLAPLGAGIAARAAMGKKALVVGVWGVLCLWARRCPHLADLAFAHGHNLLAVGIFWMWAARRRRHHWPAVAAFLGGLALLASGSLDRVSPVIGACPSSRGPLDLCALVQQLSPVTGGPWPLRLVLAFAFAQSVHYAVWVRLIPDEDRPRPGLRSFASSFRALELDLGRPFVVVACIGMAAVLGWGLVDVGAARQSYLRVSSFHAFLELAIVTLLLLEGRFPLRRTC